MSARTSASLVCIGLMALFLCCIQPTTKPAHAAGPTSFSIESVGGDVGLGGADLKETTLNVLRWVLSILTLVAVTMIIVGVIVAATTSDGERGEAARRTIVGAVIGLIIVLLAWAIVLFVARTTSNVTVNT